MDRFGLQDVKISGMPFDQGYLKIRGESSLMENSEIYQPAVNTRPDNAASITILSRIINLLHQLVGRKQKESAAT